jgi:hypothetical protein
MKSYPGDDKARELALAEKWDQAAELLRSVVEVFEGAGPRNDLALVLAAMGEGEESSAMILQDEEQDDSDIRVIVNRYFISALADMNQERGEHALERVVDLTKGDAGLTPKLSIIMRTFNRGKLIQEAFASILKQKMSDWELIIVNDGGDREVDKTIERIWEKRLVYAYARHSGPAGAFNVGLRLARGKLISFLDDDDIVYPDHYSRLSGHLDVHPELCAIYTDLKRVWIDGKTGERLKEEVHLAGPYDPSKLWSGLYIYNLMSMVIRKQCLEKMPGFLEGLFCAEDWEFMISLSKHFGFEYLPEAGGELNYREGVFQEGKRSVMDWNLQRNLILYYHGMSPFYSFSLTAAPITDRFLETLSELLDAHPEFTPALELSKLFKEPEYAPFYQLGKKLESEGRGKDARPVYAAGTRLAPYEFKLWAKLARSWLK